MFSVVGAFVVAANDYLWVHTIVFATSTLQDPQAVLSGRALKSQAEL